MTVAAGDDIAALVAHYFGRRPLVCGSAPIMISMPCRRQHFLFAREDVAQADRGESVGAFDAATSGFRPDLDQRARLEVTDEIVGHRFAEVELRVTSVMPVA